MKITAGLGSIDEYVRYVEAGADEFFCGYVPYEWNKKYGTVLPLNRREVLGINVQIGAEGEAEYMKILSGAYNDEGKADYYNYIRSLDALKASLKGDNKTIILDENSELAKILRGNY